jgi:hypothetical protein
VPRISSFLTVSEKKLQAYMKKKRQNSCQPDRVGGYLLTLAETPAPLPVDLPLWFPAVLPLAAFVPLTDSKFGGFPVLR